MSDDRQPTGSGDSANLDLLRAVAVVAVYTFHLALTMDFTPSTYLGHFGVLMFFVHTSLVLMLSLARIDRSGKPLWSTFYLRRACRIYPLSMVCVAVIVLFHLPRAPWWPWQNPDASTILANLLLYTNLAYKPEVTSVLWTLPLEVQMYLVLPLLYLAGNAYGLKGILAIWAPAIGAAIVQPHISGRLEIAQYAPCFIAGVAGYFNGFGLVRRRLPWFTWPLLLAAAMGLLACGEWFGLEHLARWVSCLVVGLAVPFFREVGVSWIRRLSAVIARYSYGIYLTHLHAQWVAWVVMKSYPLGVRLSVLALLSTALPVLLYHLVEAPMVRVGRRLADRLPSAVTRPPIADHRRPRSRWSHGNAKAALPRAHHAPQSEVSRRG